METKWSLLEKRAKITPFDIPVDYNIINILANRGIKNKKEIIEFLNPKLSNLESPQGLYDISINIKENYGPDSIAGLSSARTCNEDNFAFQKMMRVAIGTNNVDHCART